ncbi:MAG TPA: aldehyde dehydrogenase family protein [Candidatus Limnocylindrales bacterium]|jgi:1-pyrroline-5-carboxylate dehydrogenase|nr:aldehyde dehydrogenase family protein [Candidatus Limnocylindrales bacterium]
MATESKPRLKITYATLRADNEELHALYEAGLDKARAGLGGHHPNVVGGRERSGDERFEVRSPIDRDILVGTFAGGTRQDVVDAIAAARAGQPGWAATPWRDRLAILRRAADLISERQMEYAGYMAIEVGKNRLEALGEVEESADLIRYYARTMEDNDGYDHPMDNLGDPSVHTRSVLRPHGVFGVISPFNFPMALSAGPSAAAMIAGNSVVFKPSSAAPLSGVKLVDAYRDAGVPDGVINLVMGPGESVGEELQTNQGIDGIVFTGSFEVGFRLFKSFSTRWPRPAIVEMGGKNPAIVSRKADLEEAAEGIMRSAFGFGGQKCSANSRVYVEKPVHDELVRLLVEKTEAITIGDPLKRENWLGPVIDQRAVDRHQQAAAEARRDGRVFVGGERLSDGDLARGHYVEPTVVGGLPASHRLFQDELFAPFTAVHAVDSLDEAIRLANDSVYGLTAGVYSEDPAEVQQFLDRIEAGVLYVNRRAGATTGAWPGVQAFGGWKGSGSTGKAGLSMYYVAQFLREQSHTVVD